jgi:nickel/cobalt transporter (NicO) family protein
VPLTPPPLPSDERIPGQVFFAASALALASAFMLLDAASASAALAQPQNPFAVGGLEGAGGRPASGLAGFILGKQAEFSRAMTAAARAIRADWTALGGLMGIAFAYGVFHAAGPGHGKAIVASYVIANEAQLRRGAAVAAAAAALQGLVAVLLVAAAAIALGATRAALTRAVNVIELASYAAIVAFGAWLLVRKARGLWALGRGDTGEACRHFHMPEPGQAGRWSPREAAAAVFAAGLRPCTGAILILIFTLSQGILWAGVLAVAAMSAGVAVTTSAIAAAAVYFKAFAVRMAAGRGGAGAWIVAALETMAALAVLALGLLLTFGLWASVGGT